MKNVPRVNVKKYFWRALVLRDIFVVKGTIAQV
jgi:hypothetical protein